ncbi:uncharacterized protein RCC_05950 [Ramularia collo-cygni]|uniref:Uncharacterized protein n=1 Tax=Ramularia collo-cygni TaxID=112498 RepID=A0A2D3VH79_9PEZI|nr:uncharacterized protein RCC_05950 [Ramularia collo-cygni]CZT20093.1 uncharacterized protein RCC_05950 [Ramularia collo-cygni]
MSRFEFTKDGVRLGVVPVNSIDAVAKARHGTSSHVKHVRFDNENDQSPQKMADSLSECLKRERQDWELAMARCASDIARNRDTSLYNVPALMQRLDALWEWLERNQRWDLKTYDTVVRMEKPRVKTTGILFTGGELVNC